MSADVEVYDSLIASSGRLRILTTLAAERRCEFVRLRRLTRLTDGNLATHTRKLESAGPVGGGKNLRRRQPITPHSLRKSGPQDPVKPPHPPIAALRTTQTARK